MRVGDASQGRVVLDHVSIEIRPRVRKSARRSGCCAAARRRRANECGAAPTLNGQAAARRHCSRRVLATGCVCDTAREILAGHFTIDASLMWPQNSLSASGPARQSVTMRSSAKFASAR
jgi:hypothetical protein